jgi:predicted nucleic acid-binding Zn ribbon protein
MAKCKICSKMISGRSDKKFCSSRCKNYYHINLRKVTEVAVKQIDIILHRNRSILLEIMGKHKTQLKTERIVLDQKKFNFKYHTHFQTNLKGKVYYYVYDFAWMEFSDDEILIVRKKGKSDA